MDVRKYSLILKGEDPDTLPDGKNYYIDSAKSQTIIVDETVGTAADAEDIESVGDENTAGNFFEEFQNEHRNNLVHDSISLLHDNVQVLMKPDEDVDTDDAGYNDEPELIDLENEDSYTKDHRDADEDGQSSLITAGDSADVAHDHSFARTSKVRSKTRALVNPHTVNGGYSSSTSTIQFPSHIDINYILNTVNGKCLQVQLQNATGAVIGEQWNNFSSISTATEVNTESENQFTEIISNEKSQEDTLIMSEESISDGQEFIVPEMPSIRSKASQRKLIKARPSVNSSMLNISVPGGYSVRMNRYIYSQLLCRICLLAKENMVYLFGDVNIAKNGLITNSKGPSATSRYSLLAAMKSLLDIDASLFQYLACQPITTKTITAIANTAKPKTPKQQPRIEYNCKTECFQYSYISNFILTRVEYGDSLPDHICLECLDTLTSFSVFRKQIALGQARLNGIIEQVKDTLSPTVIPALGEVDIKRVEIFRNSSSIVQVREIFKASHFVHNVIRYFPDRVIDKMFSVFANTIGFKSEKLNCLKAYALDPPFATGWYCHLCGVTIRGSAAEYTEHFMGVHGVVAEDVKLPCDLCGGSFHKVDTSGISENYADHWIQHFFFHKCDQCGKFLPSLKSVWVHKKSAHPDTSQIFDCTICHKAFHKRSHLTSHIKIHMNPDQRKHFLNWCKVCGKGLRSSLKVHMDSIHNDCRSWKCEICLKQFKRREVLMTHRRTVHLNSKSHKCEMCDMILQSHSALSVHMIRCKSDLTYDCTLCKKRFATAGKLTKHIATHRRTAKNNIDSQSSCQECGKSFKRKEYLTEHLKVHSGETPYKCPHPECGKEIRMKSNFLKHLRVHARRQLNEKEPVPVLIVLEDDEAE